MERIVSSGCAWRTSSLPDGKSTENWIPLEERDVVGMIDRSLTESKKRERDIVTTRDYFIPSSIWSLYNKSFHFLGFIQLMPLRPIS